MTKKHEDITGSTLYHMELITCQCGHEGTDYFVIDKNGQYIANCAKCGRYLKAIPHSKKYAIESHIDLIWEKTLRRCCYCGKLIDLYAKNGKTYEHKVSKKQGGGNEEENIFLCCRRCNSAKGGDKDIESFRQHIMKRDGLPHYIFWFEELWYGPKAIKDIFKAIWSK